MKERGSFTKAELHTHTQTDKMWDVRFVSFLPLYADVVAFLCTAVV